jgi:hypothetical protein
MHEPFILTPLEQSESAAASGVSIHGGFPNPGADSDRTRASLDLNQLLIQHPVGTYFFRIEGHAWEDKGIYHDDLAIVDRTVDARPWDMVVWWQAGIDEFAISRRYKAPDGALVWGTITSIVHQYRKPRPKTHS